MLFRSGADGKPLNALSGIAFEVGPSGGRQVDISGTLDTRCKDGAIRNQTGMLCMNFKRTTAIQSIHQNASGEVRLGNAAYTVNTNGNASGRNAPLILAQETAHTLRGEGFDGSEDGTGRGTPIIAFMSGAGSKAGTTGACEELSPTLRAADCGNNRAPTIASTLTANWHKSNGVSAGNNSGIINPVILNSTIRRLTCLECERLMGFPDWHTLIPWKITKKLTFHRFEKNADLMDKYLYFRKHGFVHEFAMIAALCPDGQRYKACGNSMCTNAMEWIGERIAMVESITITAIEI